MNKKYKIRVPQAIVKGGWNKVAGIRAIRALTGDGLKESKDLIEAAVGQQMPMTVRQDRPGPYSDSEIAEALRDLKAAGVEVVDAGADTRQMIIATINEAAIFATMSGEYDLAARLNQFLFEERERG